jgi:hypothetical protein
MTIRRLRIRELLDALATRGIEFVVIGGLALPANGYVRATKALDIVPSPEPANLGRLAAALRDLDTEVDLGDLSGELGIEPDAEGLGLGGNWVLQTKFGRLDVLQEVAGMRGYARLRQGAIEDAGVFYAGYEDLIAMKAAAGRPQDLIDIAELERARGER